VKWGKKKFDNIEVNLADPPAVFKAQLFTLSGVLPERQKSTLFEFSEKFWRAFCVV
jgi:ubiquitin carboxyl-terminal hydrolase 14